MPTTFAPAARAPPPKCLWCGGLHPSPNCPNRGQGGTSANRKRAFGSFLGGFVGMMSDETSLILPPTVEEIANQAAEEAEKQQESIAFNMETCKGYGVLDGGATKSAGGIEQLIYLQQRYLNERGVDFEVQPSNVEFLSLIHI